MQQNQKSLNLNEKNKIPTQDIETIKIRFSVFFDDTLNNKTNIDQRILASPDSQLTKEEKKAQIKLKEKTSANKQDEANVLYKKHGRKKEGQENSYEGYYTNIAIMEKYVEPAANAQYKLNLQTYIEGSGSLDKAGDQKAGYAFAIWESGIPAKVKKGLNNVINKIRRSHTQKNIVIEEITLDIFGFSRGAASST